METKNQTDLDSYQKWQPILDTGTMVGAGAATCLVYQISLLDPTGLGILLASGVNALTVSATSRILASKQIQSSFLKTCAIVAVLALSALSLPFLLGALGTHSIILLSSEAAIQLGLIHLAAKVTTYILFRTALFFRDYFFFSFPKDIAEVSKLETPALRQVQTHLLNFPSKTQALPLPFQFALNQKLTENDIAPLPLISFSEIGKNWSIKDLRQLHNQDSSRLPLHKKAALAELFMHHEFPPQNRSYTKDELPEIDPNSFEKTLSRPRVLWYHLILRLNPSVQLHPKINKQFYQLQLPPPRSDSIDLPTLTTEKAIAALADYQLPWYSNLYKERPENWAILTPALQSAFTKRLSQKTDPAIGKKGDLTSLFERISKWGMVALPVVATIGIVYRNFSWSWFNSPNIKGLSTPKNALINLQNAASSFKEKVTIPESVRTSLLTKTGDCAKQALTLTKAVPEAIKSINIDAAIKPINAIKTDILTDVPSETANSLSHLTAYIPSLASSLFYPTLAIAGIGTLGVLSVLYTRHKLRSHLSLSLGANEIRDSIIKQPAAVVSVDDVDALQRKEKKPKEDKGSAVVADGDDNAGHSNAVLEKLKDDKEKEEVPKQQSHPDVLSQVNGHLDELPIKLQQLGSLSVEGEDRNNIPPLVQEADLQPLQGMIEEVAPKKETNWEAFNTYVTAHCKNVELERAKALAIEGLDIIRKLHNNQPVERSNLEEKMRAVCWGLMAHAAFKGQAYVEGTFDIKDPGYRIFNFFYPIYYGRSSTHYKSRAIAITEGKWKGYKHVGVDLEDLPAEKRTVMLGKITTLDGSERIYLKPENYSANINWLSDPRALSPYTIGQTIVHGLEVVPSQAKRLAPSIFGEVGGGLNMRKEHMREEDKHKIKGLIKKINKPDVDIDIDGYGFAAALPFLEATLRAEGISEELKEEIRSFLSSVLLRYDNCLHRKGDEVGMGDSVFGWDVPFVQPKRCSSLDDFVELCASDTLTDSEIAAGKLSGNIPVSTKTLTTYALQLSKTNPIGFIEDLFLLSDIEMNSEQKIQALFNKLYFADQNKLIYLPFILVPEEGSNQTDQIVLLTLDPKTQTIEYYNSQGGDLRKETRNVLGIDLPANQLLEILTENNKSPLKDWRNLQNNHSDHQGDQGDSGAFICNLMRARIQTPFDQLCQDAAIDVQTVRRKLANDLTALANNSDDEDAFGFTDLEASVPHSNLSPRANAAPMADWERAALKLRGSDYLHGSTVKTYANYLQDRAGEDRPFILVEDFLYTALVEAMCKSGPQPIQQKIQDVLKLSDNKKPIFIPFILKNIVKDSWFGGLVEKAEAYTGPLCADHIVILALDPATRTAEYYNSQGGALSDETRNVLGLENCPANQFLTYLDPAFRDWKLVHNSEVHQTDWVNCGAFVSIFMKQKQDGRIYLKPGMDMPAERAKLADDLFQFYKK